MAVTITSKEEFRRLLRGLADDVVAAAIHWRLYNDLCAAVPEYLQEYNQAPAFWSLTISAHLRAVHTVLSRVYDQHSHALSLGSLLQTIRDRWGIIGESPDKCGNQPSPDPDTLKSDLEEVSEHDVLVSKLIKLRSAFYAHLNAKNIARQLRLHERFPLEREEIDTLIARAVRVLNRYGGLTLGHTWSTDMMGRDDFEYVLKSVRTAMAVHEAEIDREIAAADSDGGA